MLDSVCLINANARIYDPTLGRFLSADPQIESPDNLQDLNRYSYVGNNPLSFTDPSGLCFLGCFWKSPIFAAIVGIVIAVFAPEILGAAESLLGVTVGTLGNFAIAGALAGAASAGLSGGNILKGALFGGIGGLLFAGVGVPLGNTLGNVFDDPVIGNFIAQGLVGGLNSEISGGNFASGFLAAGVASLAGPLTGGKPGEITTRGIVVSAVLGGAASVLGGGKFENGAITGAFAYVALNLSDDLLGGAKYGDGSDSVPIKEIGIRRGFTTPDMAANFAVDEASTYSDFKIHEYGGAIFSYEEDVGGRPYSNSLWLYHLSRWCRDCSFQRHDDLGRLVAHASCWGRRCCKCVFVRRPHRRMRQKMRYPNRNTVAGDAWKRGRVSLYTILRT